MRPTPFTTGLIVVAAPIGMAAFSTLLLWTSGNWFWLEGWVFSVWWISFVALLFFWMRSRDPALLIERLRLPGTGGESGSDAAILIGIKLCFLASLFLPALGMRYGWAARLPLWCRVCGGILLVGGSYPFFRAFTDNTYVSQLVRIQAERGQRVIDTGVYSFVRHPMYLGACITFLGAGLLLGSVYGLFADLALIALVILRIFGEEKLLARDLEGYAAYCQRVRFRLIPHLW